MPASPSPADDLRHDARVVLLVGDDVRLRLVRDAGVGEGLARVVADRHALGGRARAARRRSPRSSIDATAAGLSGGVMITSRFCTKSVRSLTPGSSATASIHVPLALANTSAVPSLWIWPASASDAAKLKTTVVPGLASSNAGPDPLAERVGERGGGEHRELRGLGGLRRIVRSGVSVRRARTEHERAEAETDHHPLHRSGPPFQVRTGQHIGLTPATSIETWR